MCSFSVHPWCFLTLIIHSLQQHAIEAWHDRYKRRVETRFPSFLLCTDCPTEPGYYKDGGYGIRIENVLLVREAQTPNNFGDKGYLCFENVTMVRTLQFTSTVRADRFISTGIFLQCPIQTKLIAQDILSPSEREWVNKYHETVLAKLSPHLANDPGALEWLKKECAPI